jgi:hypothetical protein
MRIARYYPSFCDDDDFDSYTAEVVSMQELLGLSWVKRWESEPGFAGWLVEDNMLMAATLNGTGFPRKGGFLVAYAYEREDQPWLSSSVKLSSLSGSWSGLRPKEQTSST